MENNTSNNQHDEISSHQYGHPSASQSLANNADQQSALPVDDPSQNASQNPNDRNDLLTPAQRRERLLTLITIGVIAFLTGVDYAIILPTAWGYINTFMQYHFAGFVMGVLLSVFALSGAVVGILFGYMDDMGVSLKKMVLVGIACLILGNILYFIGINVYVLVISRLIAGVGMGLVPPLLAELTRRSTPQTRTQLFARVLGCRQIGLFLGPCFTIFFKQLNFTFFGLPVTMHNAPGLLMAILWTIQVALVVAFFYDSPTRHDAKSPANVGKNNSLGQIFRQFCILCKNPIIVVLLITSFIAYFNQTALETTLTPFTNYQFNWNEIRVSLLFAAAGVEITIVYIVLNYVSKKVSDQTILLFAYITLSVACLIGVIVLPFTKVGSTTLLPVFLLFVALDVLSLPLIAVTTTTLFTREINDEQQGIGQGVQRFVVNVATVVGPLYAGALLKTTWIMLLSMFVIVLFATILVVFIYRSFRSRKNGELAALIPPVSAR